MVRGYSCGWKESMVLPFQIIFIIVPCLIYYWIKALIVTLFRIRKRKSLEGETILITGSISGIGRELVLLLRAKYKDSVNLVLWDINETALKKLAEEINSEKVFCYPVDVSNYVQVEHNAAKVLREVGHVSILINNAGVAVYKTFLDHSHVELEKTVGVNLLAHFWTMKAFIPHMLDRKKGHIVAVASMAAFFGLRFHVPYCTTKYGLRGMMDGLRKEENHIKLSTVYPFFVKTPLINNRLNIRFRFPKLSPKLDPSYVAEKILDGIERNEEHIFIPYIYKWTIWLMNIAPESVRVKMQEMMVAQCEGIKEEQDEDESLHVSEV